jgi:hypothetical protein
MRLRVRKAVTCLRRQLDVLLCLRTGTAAIDALLLIGVE